MRKESQKNVVVVRKSAGRKTDYHGGSWKIAYADFMTAMMSFFLVMWLVASSNPEQRQHIADYFNMPLSTLSQKTQGDKDAASPSLIPGGGEDMMTINTQTHKASVRKRVAPPADEAKKFQFVHKDLLNVLRSDANLKPFQSNIRVSLRPDGMLIQILDSHDRPMFMVGSWKPESYMKVILTSLAPFLNKLPYRMIITGHTDSLAYVGGEAGYSNWELSAERANSARRILMDGGLDNGKVLQIIGDADMLNPQTLPSDDPSNRRITLLVLSPEKESEILHASQQYFPSAISESQEKSSVPGAITPVGHLPVSP